MVMNLNQTSIWYEAHKETSTQWTHYDIENDKTTQWHKKEREGERKRGGGGDRGQKLQVLWTRLNEDKNYYEQD